jgi:hypothetical protein
LIQTAGPTHIVPNRKTPAILIFRLNGSFSLDTIGSGIKKRIRLITTEKGGGAGAWTAYISAIVGLTFHLWNRYQGAGDYQPHDTRDSALSIQSHALYSVTNYSIKELMIRSLW